MFESNFHTDLETFKVSYNKLGKLLQTCNKWIVLFELLIRNLEVPWEREILWLKKHCPQGLFPHYGKTP